MIHAERKPLYMEFYDVRIISPILYPKTNYQTPMYRIMRCMLGWTKGRSHISLWFESSVDEQQPSLVLRRFWGTAGVLSPTVNASKYVYVFIQVRPFVFSTLKVPKTILLSADTVSWFHGFQFYSGGMTALSEMCDPVFIHPRLHVLSVCLR